jgi:hypothetical protein
VAKTADWKLATDSQHRSLLADSQKLIVGPTDLDRSPLPTEEGGWPAGLAKMFGQRAEILWPTVECHLVDIHSRVLAKDTGRIHGKKIATATRGGSLSRRSEAGLSSVCWTIGGGANHGA